MKMNVFVFVFVFVFVVDDTPINVTLLSHLIARLPECSPVTFTEPQKGLD